MTITNLPFGNALLALSWVTVAVQQRATTEPTADSTHEMRDLTKWIMLNLTYSSLMRPASALRSSSVKVALNLDK